MVPDGAARGFEVFARVVEATDEELFYLLEGELILVGPDDETTARSGACISLPRGVPHGFRNASGAPLRMLVALRPGVQGLEMFREFARRRSRPRRSPRSPAATA